MILWLIALVLVGCVGTVGYYQGALRAAFSFVGLLLAAMLASPVGSLLKPLILILGLKNPVEIAFVAPVAAFAIVLVLFKAGAFAVHKKVEAWYKYKSSDTHLTGSGTGIKDKIATNHQFEWSQYCNC